MQYLDIWVGFFALFCLSAFIGEKSKLSAPLCPLIALSLSVLWLFFGGLLGQLNVSLYLLYGISLGGGILAFRKNIWRNFYDGAFLFWLSGLFFLIYFCFLQPVFTSYDEYSMWGTAAKQTSIFKTLYTVAPSGTPWQATEFTALPLISYFFQGYGYFSPWKAIFAQNILLLASFSPLLVLVDVYKKLNIEKATKKTYTQHSIFILTFFLAVLFPTFFTINGHTVHKGLAWLSFLADIPSGVVFGGVVALWFALKKSSKYHFWFILPVLCLSANIKNNTFVFALAAAGIISLDILFFSNENFSFRTLISRFVKITLCLVAPILQYSLWVRHTAVVVAQNSTDGGWGATSQPLSTVLTNGIKMLIGLPVSDYYENLRADFWGYGESMQTLFFTQDVCLFGTGFECVLIIISIFAVAVCLAQTTKQRLCAVVSCIAGTLCLALYNLMLWLSYAFILKDSSPTAPASYARYVTPYYLGWFIIALAVLFGTLSKRKTSRALCAVLIALCALMGTKSFISVEAQFSVLGISEAEFKETRAEYATANAVSAFLKPEDTLYFVAQGDDGYRWFLYHQALLPNILTYGDGGASIGFSKFAEETKIIYRPYTPEEFLKKVLESKATYILILQSDAVFAESYSELFSDSLAFADEGVYLYKVTENGFETPILIEKHIEQSEVKQ